MNVQNIPRDDKVVKAAFMPKLEAFLFFDYPNIELKLLAFYLESLGHPSMAQTFRDGADLHRRTAAGLYAVTEDAVTDAQRQVAKRVNFSIVYGGGVPTLIEQGVVPDGKAAMDLLRRYHGTWPGIGWASKNRNADQGTLNWYIAKRVAERGYITTLWGRHLHPASMHKAINALCQGCAADLMKWALVRVHRELRDGNYHSHLVNVVHDELALDSLGNEIELLVEAVPHWMTDARIAGVVPITPEPDISYSTWADKRPYEGDA